MHLQAVAKDDCTSVPTLSIDKIAPARTELHTITVKRHQLPLTINYDNKTYILVLTRSNKLLLQKPL